MTTFSHWLNAHVLDEVSIECEEVMVTVVTVANAALVRHIVLVVDDGWEVHDKSGAISAWNRR